MAEHIAAVLVRILFEDPAPVENKRPGLPQAVGELVRRMLAKHPEQRLASASAVAAALSTIAQARDLPVLPTLPAPAKATPLQTDSEQVLLSLVLAISPHHEPAEGLTARLSEVEAEQAQSGLLLAELREMGARADLLLGGALVITVPQMESAQDQAVQAARCASLVRERWPQAQVVLVTGRGSRSRGGLTGEVLDRAWRLFESQTAAVDSPKKSSPQIRLDQVSAGLLESRFDLEPLPTASGGFALGNERLDQDGGRLLLGKPTPCVGRERELATLEAVLTECKEESVARAVLVLAPPGLGKSRLRHEFMRRVVSRGEPLVILMGRGDPLNMKSAYGMIGEALRRRLEIFDGQDREDQRARLRALIGARLPGADGQRVTVFLGELCGVPFADDESPQLRAARQDPRLMSDQVEQAFLEALGLLRTDATLLLILEDLHWSDALTDSPAALQYGLDGINRVPVGSSWMFRICGSMITLAGLSGRHEIMQDSISRILSIEPLPEAAADFLEQAATLTSSLCPMGMRRPASILLPRMQRAANQLATNDLASQGWLNYGQTWYLRFMEHGPWEALDAAQSSLQSFTAAGVPRGIAMAEMALGPALSDVGDTAAALTVSRDLMRRGEVLHERMFIGVGSYYVGRFLLRLGKPEDVAEAHQLAFNMLAMQETSLLGVSNALLGLALAALGNHDAAELALRAAIENNLFFKAEFLDSWAQCLLHLGRLDEARRAIEQGLPLLEGEFGSANCAVSLHATAAQIYQATGDRAMAAQALGEALRLLTLRSAKAPDAASRERFLTQVPANARALALASSPPMPNVRTAP